MLQQASDRAAGDVQLRAVLADADGHILAVGGTRERDTARDTREHDRRRADEHVDRARGLLDGRDVHDPRGWLTSESRPITQRVGLARARPRVTICTLICAICVSRLSPMLPTRKLLIKLVAGVEDVRPRVADRRGERLALLHDQRLARRRGWGCWRLAPRGS